MEITIHLTPEEADFLLSKILELRRQNELKKIDELDKLFGEKVRMDSQYHLDQK